MRTPAEQADFVIESIEKLGLELDPSSRLMQMYRALTKKDGTKTKSGYHTALEALRDMQLLEFVFDHLESNSWKEGFKALVKTSLKDSVKPEKDRSNSRGRDAQFELFVAAICESAGLKPVDFDEPDVICHYENTKIGIAAKRVKHVRQFGKRLREGAKQIANTGLPGIIALDTCICLNKENKKIRTSIDDRTFSKIYCLWIYDFVDSKHKTIQNGVNRCGVRGVVLHDHQLKQGRDGDWELHSMTFRIPTGVNDLEIESFEQFFSSYFGGLPNGEEAI